MCTLQPNPTRQILTVIRKAEAEIMEVTGLLVRLTADLPDDPELTQELTPVVPMEDVIGVVCAHTGISVLGISRKIRRREYVRARHLCMLLIRQFSPRTTLGQIGQRLGGLDHTTIIHGLKTIERDMLHEPGLKETISELKSKILS